MSSVNLLERNVKKILSSAGFDPQLRADLDGYEIDVYVEYKSERIVFECKQYQRGSLTVRNLIHQWSGKQEELGVDRVVLVLVGVSVSEDDYELAEKREIEIWRGEKVDSLLDDVVDGATNLREKILSELGLRDEKVESKIKNIIERHDVTRKTAEKYLRDDLSYYMFRKLSDIESSLMKSFDEDFDVLSERDKRKYRENEEYYGNSFRKVVKKMGELGIDDKKVARLFIDKEGGTANGERYYNRQLKRIEFIILNFGWDFEKAKEYVDANKPTMKNLRRAENVKTDRPDLELEEIYHYLEEGFTVREIKKDEAERGDEKGDEESSGEDEDHESEADDEREESEESSPKEDAKASEEESEDHGATPVIDLDSGELVSEGEQGKEAQNEQHSEVESKNLSVSTPLLTVLVLVVLTVLLLALLA